MGLSLMYQQTSLNTYYDRIDLIILVQYIILMTVLGWTVKLLNTSDEKLLSHYIPWLRVNFYLGSLSW